MKRGPSLLGESGYENLQRTSRIHSYSKYDKSVEALTRWITKGEQMKKLQYRKKPVVIEAIKWDGSEESWLAMVEFVGPSLVGRPEFNTLKIKTLEGDMFASTGDMIIKGVAGEFYPCKPDIFEATYEAV